MFLSSQSSAQFMLQGLGHHTAPQCRCGSSPPPLWGGVGLELTTYPHNTALTCRRTHLPTAPPEQGILSLKLVQRTMSLEKLQSMESLLKSLILVGKLLPAAGHITSGGGPKPLATGTFICYIINDTHTQYCLLDTIVD